MPTIQGREVTLGVPDSYTMRVEVWALTSTNYTRAAAAALGMCWKGRGRPRASYVACGFSPAVYGEKVLNELVDRGVDITEILEAATEALSLIRGGLATEKEVAATVDFSDSPPADEPG